MGRNGNPHFVRQVGNANHRLFSAFLHGAYVCIMEMFNPITKKFETNGLLKSPRMADCENYFANHIYQAILASALVAGLVDRSDVKEQLLKLREEVAQETNCVAP